MDLLGKTTKAQRQTARQAKKVARTAKKTARKAARKASPGLIKSLLKRKANKNPNSLVQIIDKGLAVTVPAAEAIRQVNEVINTGTFSAPSYPAPNTPCVDCDNDAPCIDCEDGANNALIPAGTNNNILPDEPEPTEPKKDNGKLVLIGIAALLFLGPKLFK